MAAVNALFCKPLASNGVSQHLALCPAFRHSLALAPRESAACASSRLRFVSEGDALGENASVVAAEDRSSSSRWSGIPVVDDVPTNSSGASGIPDSSNVIPGSSGGSELDGIPSSVDAGSTVDLSGDDLLREALSSDSSGISEQPNAVDMLKSAGLTSLTRLQENAEAFINDKVLGPLNDGVGSVKHFYSDLNAAIVKKINDSGDAITGLDWSSPLRKGTPANDVLKNVFDSVRSTSEPVIVFAGNTVLQVYVAAKSLAPAGVQDALETVEKQAQKLSVPLSSAVERASEFVTRTEEALGLDPENPIIPTIVFIGGSLFVGTAYWQSTYGGYAGDISSEEVIEMLKTDKNLVLVDIRSEARRNEDGVPDVRRQGRSKLASLAPVRVEGPLRSLMRNANEVEQVMTATLIKNLKNVNANSKVVVMDADGKSSKKIARALRKVGLKRPYSLRGGFKAWEESGLKTKVDTAQTPLAVIKEDAEDIAEELKPAGVIGAILGSATLAYAVYEWERTLQLIGVIAILQAVYKRINSYETADDLKADIRTLQTPLVLAFEGVRQVLGQAKPEKLELATSPSTTEVQDRVIQAAAKHEAVVTNDEPTASMAQEDGEASAKSSEV